MILSNEMRRGPALFIPISSCTTPQTPIHYITPGLSSQNLEPRVPSLLLRERIKASLLWNLGVARERRTPRDISVASVAATVRIARALDHATLVSTVPRWRALGLWAQERCRAGGVHAVQERGGAGSVYAVGRTRSTDARWRGAVHARWHLVVGYIVRSFW